MEDDPNPPPQLEQDDNPLQVPVQAAQSDPPPKDDEDQGDTKNDRDIIIKDKRIIIEARGTTPITLAEDQLLDDQVGTGAETPSRAVAELFSQMNVVHPPLHRWQVILLTRAKTPKEEPLAPTSDFHCGLFIILGVIQTLWRQVLPPPVRWWKKTRTEPGTITKTPRTELFKKFLLT